ncbi:hypothetical protein [Pandoraea apista]|uniref:hypothetical protein n=2 Tax=Pandoraea apista TaxID=93218 RepID=UPI00065A506C|nr:hypothetical protein [Pandoraea apista]ALS63842.1 hypothetical protein AT395_01390 [Pandoraea apista]RRW98566.1 hypothetical protein EGJ54_03705 [Pandoraea apista]CFB63397.1 hypothetical protein LMG16407_03474 [Pandoraea apista]
MSTLRRLRAPRRSGTGLFAVCLVALALASGSAFAAAAQSTAKPAAKTMAKSPPKPPPFDFAVLGNTPFGNTEVPVVRSVLANIGDTQAAFVIHAGNFKDINESCRDELVTQRLSLLASSPKPLMYVPGANDWADCQRAGEGNYNPVERLDFLRDHAFDDDALLGPGPVGFAQFDLTRQSEMARFRQYRENVRWFYRGVVFVGLNLPGNNNNYRSAGGRNGEYEDRVIATRVWLQHAAVYAQQKDAIGMVIVAQADPEFEPARSGGLGGIFSDRSGRRGIDGYKDFRTQLQRLASRFKGPILLIDSGKTMRHTQPLRDAHGAPVRSFTQLSSFGSPAANRWVRVRVDPRAPQLFRFEGMMLPVGSSPAPGSQRGNGAVPAAAVPLNPEPGRTATGTVPHAAPYSALYPSSGVATGAGSSSATSSDPNQGVMPIGPALPPNTTPHPAAPGR